jgi:predicted nucleotidyltransferase
MLVTGFEIQALADALGSRFKPERIVLFGSRARGEARAESDVDLLAIMKYEGPPIRKAVGLSRGVEVFLPLDLVVRAPGEVRWRFEQGDPIIRATLDRGRTLVGRAA